MRLYQNLQIAMIPMGIPSLGQGAFANCGQLKIVSIPASVKSIGSIHITIPAFNLIPVPGSP